MSNDKQEPYHWFVGVRHKPDNMTQLTILCPNGNAAMDILNFAQGKVEARNRAIKRAQRLAKTAKVPDDQHGT